ERVSTAMRLTARGESTSAHRGKGFDGGSQAREGGLPARRRKGEMATKRRKRHKSGGHSVPPCPDRSTEPSTRNSEPGPRNLILPALTLRSIWAGVAAAMLEEAGARWS